MKAIKIVVLGVSLLMAACAPMKQMAQGRTDNAVSNTVPLPTGNYFIVNANGQALQPWQPSVTQNVFLQPFNHGGMQQWHVTRTPNTSNYTIKLVGTDAMYLQPNYVKDHTPMIATDRAGATFKITAATGSQQTWLIKCAKYNGDAMHSFVFSPELPTELRFDPSDGSQRYQWRFIEVKE